MKLFATTSLLHGGAQYEPGDEFTVADKDEADRIVESGLASAKKSDAENTAELTSDGPPEDLSKLSVKQLQALAAANDLDVSGSKKDPYIQALEQHYAEVSSSTGPDVPA